MILARLKSGTADLHEEVERVVDVFREGFDLPSYRDLLGRFLGFYEPAEARLLGVDDPEFVGFYAPRRKAGLLRGDLLALGVAVADVDGLPRCPSPLPCRGLADAMGIAYVFEGASLGGALIARHVEKTFGLAPGVGDAFFRPSGGSPGPRWEEFREFCTRRAAEVDEGAVVDAARATFGRLGDWLGCDG